MQLDGPFTPTEWHAHALLFGYSSAAIAGFAVTAVPNWTGRLPIIGWPLAGLVAMGMAMAHPAGTSGIEGPIRKNLKKTAFRPSI